MAIAKRTSHKSLVKNPPRSGFLRKPAARKAVSKTNPAKSRKPVRRRSYRRNPSPTTNAIVFALGGALTINVIDEAVRRFMPTISAPISVGLKLGAGWAIGKYGSKLLGGWAGIAQNALYLAAALTAIDQWVKPLLPGFFTTAAVNQPQPVAQQQITNPSTGQLGIRYALSDGNLVDIYEGDQQTATAFA